MTSAWNLNWLNLNAQRSYPLSEQATATDISGSITLPDSFIVALQFAMQASPGLNPANFFLQSVILAPTGYTLTIAYNGTSVIPAATTSIAAATHVENNSYILTGIAPFDGCTGAVSIGNLDDINALPPGQYTFDTTGGLLDPDAIRPQLQELSSITLVNGTETSNKIYGDVILTAGTNISFSIVTQSGQPTQIVINAISGAGLNQNCACEGIVADIPIVTINGITGDANGNFRLSGENCVNIAAETNGLLLTNNCASPCCGCKELDALNVQVDLLSNNVATMQNFQSRLSSEVTNMSLVVLGSRLGDSACGNGS